MALEKLTFRDKLALDRTLLAEERTNLAYLRTGLTFVGIALFLGKFFPLTPNGSIIFFIATSLGVVLTLYGLYKVLIMHMQRIKFEHKYIEWID